jgi:type IV secretion system protein VirB10
MSVRLASKGADPRLSLEPEALREASICAAPQVGQAARGPDLSLVAGGIGAIALGAMTLFAMSGNGRSPARTQLAAPAAAARPVQPTAVPAQKIAVSTDAIDPTQARTGPLVVDNTEGATSARGAAPPPAKPAAAPTPPAGPGQAAAPLSADEQFSLRVGGDSATAHAERIGDPGSLVVQGTMIPAVLETALNSDLPGYARAIVSRDVRSFDGEKVVIPRGSRLIGQYKSGLASGQSRAFIVWSRLIRPDGVSIQLGSPVMDESGQTGLGGKVDRHFLQRFGGAMLLSVIGALPSALAGGSSTALVINSGSGESGVSAALQADARTPPTIRVPLGTPIQVFVARDLDFAGR